MTTPAKAVFLFNLLQDVNILRPLVFIARDLDLRPEMMVSSQFLVRDKSGQWARELNEIANATGSPILVYEDAADAMQLLPSGGGALVAASESNLSAHAQTHDVMRVAPANFLKITLQHGFECVGFLQSRDHDTAHGRSVGFGSDVLCGWFDGERMASMTPSQRSKLYVTGPTAVLQMRQAAAERPRASSGIVCENLHSVRLNIAGDFKTAFMAIFDDFCKALAAEDRPVTLRPHPGGQYVLKNDVPLQPNVTLNNNPVYKVDLAKYAYGISAPSSVLIDMVLAGIPVGVWRDESGKMDAGNYAGLTEISTLGDWIDFSKEAGEHPDRFLDRQADFLEKQLMITDPKEVQARFIRLFRSAGHVAAAARARRSSSAMRVMFVANGMLPTLQLSFIKPLARSVQDGDVMLETMTEQDIRDAFGKAPDDTEVHSWIANRLARFRPDLIVFCRYSGPYSRYMTDRARREGIPTIYHIDDDLLNIPIEIGEAKHRYHNAPERTGSVRHLLDTCDLVYASTKRLGERLKTEKVATPITVGQIYCPGHVITPATRRPVRKFGYMASADHAHNLEMILPAIVDVMRDNPDVSFELFGSIPRPAALAEFGDRVVCLPPIQNYEQFLTEFAKLNWDIGVCPLTPIDFNLMKANTKWVEYTSVGAAVVASRDTVYDECCSDGCGILASTPEEWRAGLEHLIRDPDAHYEQVKRAQKKLETEYSIDQLRSQVFDVFETVRKTNMDAAA